REALVYYQVARALRPATAHELAHLLENMGRGEEAEAVIRELTQLDPRDARHLGCCGRLLLERGKKNEADALLDRAIKAGSQLIEREPDNALAHYNRGTALMALNRLTDALAAYDRAIELKPDYALAHNGRGNTLQILRKLDDAIAAYAKAIDL